MTIFGEPYGRYTIQKRTKHSRYVNWEVFLDGKYVAQFFTKAEAKAWCDKND